MNDRLDDIFGDDLANVPFGEPKALPQDAASVRIRETTPEFAERCPKCRGTGRFISYSGRPLGECFACKNSHQQRWQNRREQHQGHAGQGMAVPQLVIQAAV